MLFWLFVIIMAIGIGLIMVGGISWDYDKHNFLWRYDETILVAGVFISGISFLVVVVMLFSIIDTHVSIEANLEQNRETYNALIYKMESKACRDEFGFLGKEVIDEIQEWNKYVRYYQSIQDNFWVGIFYPNVYDEFKTIDYESYRVE